jgi:hypothetical protein
MAYDNMFTEPYRNKNWKKSLQKSVILNFELVQQGSYDGLYTSK